MSAPHRVEPVTFALAPSISLEAILGRRDAFIAKLHELARVYGEMRTVAEQIFGPTDASGEAFRVDYDTALEWTKTGRQLDGDEQLDLAVKRVDAACWSRMLELSGLRQLMDNKLRQEWDEQLQKLQMPEFTEANINATFAALAAERDDIFERGIINVFRSLSWDYKTNSPVKFGKRMIVKYACESRLWVNRKEGTRGYSLYGPTHEFANKLDDLVRAFCVLEGKPEPDHMNGAWHMLSATWMETVRNGKGDVPVGVKLSDDDSTAELHGYVRFRGFKNRNAHLTFLRLDLVDELNKIIARRYPNAFPPASEHA